MEVLKQVIELSTEGSNKYFPRFAKARKLAQKRFEELERERVENVQLAQQRQQLMETDGAQLSRRGGLSKLIQGFSENGVERFFSNF